MPTYLLKCERCDHEWEVFQSSTKPLPNVCTSCGSDDSVKQVLTASHKLYFGPMRPLRDRMK